MYIIDPNILLGITLLMLILVTFRSFFLRRAVQQASVKIASTVKKLQYTQKELDTLKEKEKSFNDFNNDLQQAEIATRIQRSRCASLKPAETPQPPERYRYIHSLTSKGIGATDIAEILAISSHEADQLVQLANLSRSD